MLIVRSLYSMESAGANFRAIISKKWHSLGYRPLISYPDVCMSPAIKPGRFRYYKNVIFYADGVIWISDEPICTNKGIQVKFKLKGGNI